MAEVFLNYGVKNVIIKTGQNGCFAKNHKISLSMPAFRVNAIDSTGAGDNFAAGFLSALLRGSSFKNALSFASACAAICVQSVGATSGVQSRAQAEKFLLIQDTVRYNSQLNTHCQLISLSSVRMGQRYLGLPALFFRIQLPLWDRL